MTEGIPQGTTLGLLLFTVYVFCADDIDAIDDLKLDILQYELLNLRPVLNK